MTSSLSRRELLLTLALAAGRLPGQDTTFSGGVSVVNVLASVRDKQGRVVSDLNKDDFVLSENGVPQTIGYFSRQSDLPLTLGLLVDTSLSQRRVLEDEKSASHTFVSHVLREDRDRTFLIHFDHDTELLQDFTSSRTVLDKALDKVQIAESPRLVRRGPNGGGGGPPRPDNDRYPTPQGTNGRRNAGTVLYDAIYLAADELLRHETGRKAIVVLTDGVDQGSKVGLHTAIEAAQRADLMVYSILFADEAGYAQPPVYGRGGGRGHRGGPIDLPRRVEHADGKNVLQQISKENGGGFFEVSKKQSIDDIYRRIEEELRNQYNIGYTPPKSDDTRYREISLTAKRKDLIVQSREGYYPNKQ